MARLTCVALDTFNQNEVRMHEADVDFIQDLAFVAEHEAEFRGSPHTIRKGCSIDKYLPDRVEDRIPITQIDRNQTDH